MASLGQTWPPKPSASTEASYMYVYTGFDEENEKNEITFAYGTACWEEEPVEPIPEVSVLTSKEYDKAVPEVQL